MHAVPVAESIAIIHVPAIHVRPPASVAGGELVLILVEGRKELLIVFLAADRVAEDFDCLLDLDVGEWL